MKKKIDDTFLTSLNELETEKKKYNATEKELLIAQNFKILMEAKKKGAS